jgi:pentatricopeptide repeat protein
MYRNAKLLWPVVSRSLNVNLKRPALRSFASLQQKTFEQPLERSMPTSSNNTNEQWTTYCNRVAENDTTLTAVDFNEICKNIVRDHSIETDQAIDRLQLVLRHMHDRVSDQGMTDAFLRGCNMLMHSYVSKGDVRSARMVFEGLINSGHEPSIVSISTIIYGIRKHGVRSDLYQFVQLLEKKGLVPDSTVYYTRLINTLRSFEDLRGCRYYFAEMVKKGVEIDELAYKTMLGVYKESKQPAMALKLFHEMKEKGIEPSMGSYGYLISALSTDKSLKKPMEEVFEELRRSKAPMNVSIYLMMNWDPIEALMDMKKANVKCDIRDYNACLASYVKKNRFPEAMEVFKLMNKDEVTMDVYCYSILIDALAKDIETPPKTVFDLYEDMKKNNISADVVSYTSLMSACNRAEDLDKAMSLLEEMQTYGVRPNIYTFNSVLSIVANMAGRSSVDLERATLIWSKMTSMGIQPDTRTFNVYLSILSKLTKPQQLDNTKEVQPSTSLWGDEFEDSTQHVPSTVKEMLRMYRYMRRNNNESMQPDFVSYAIVINALSASGQLRSAMQVYGDAKMDRITLPVAAYNEIIAALQRGGKLSEAMNVWHDMRLQGVLPDSTTYELVLEGCEQLGLADSLQSIRNQRKLDFQRLVELDRKKAERMARARAQYNYEE